MAAVTYGNAKKADVIAIDGNSAVSIEVKSTSEPESVLGNDLPANDSKIWVHLRTSLRCIMRPAPGGANKLGTGPRNLLSTFKGIFGWIPEMGFSSQAF